MFSIRTLTALFALAFSLPVVAQTDTTTLGGITVHGYSQQRELVKVPAAVSLVRPQDLQRLSGQSILPALNALPGVRMEERSPGSYRLNIRGSSLRSPFGVRNVKTYYNGLPFTDPGGNTYLNQFAVGSFTDMEILKGPGSSLYGAGTGGVLLADNDFGETDHFTAGYTGGSYGSHLVAGRGNWGNEQFRQQAMLSWQESNGYRAQTYMHRSVAGWGGQWKPNDKATFEGHVLFGDLFYETPGGLTLAQYEADKRQARPAGGGFPSAAQAHAAIHQQTLWGGLQFGYRWNEHWQQTTGVYGAFSTLENPTIRNYEKRREPHFGGRTVFTYARSILRVTAGGEIQHGNFSTKVFTNADGEPGTLQTDDKINNTLYSLFLQPELLLPHGWTITAGISMNNTRTAFTRVSETPVFKFTSRYKNEWAPRFAVMKQIHPWANVYAVVSKGFSPPTVAELLPSTSVINTTLQAEKGWNYEAGVRGGGKGGFWYDVNVFWFRLQDAIVQRRDASGADYFENAGATTQKGFEALLQYRFNTLLALRGAYTYYHFRYDEFRQQDKVYDGNVLPGTPANTVSATADFGFTPAIHLFLTYQYNSDTWLNDANTDKATSFHLLGIKAQYTYSRQNKWWAEIFAGAENLLDETYSLGNDINAAAGRYYNTAPGRNFYAGFRIGIDGKK
ncbi:TonB-dependent receptor [Chitinophaga barathri]|uniref:TonB-dependent receptor n=1 Tax=Chitinophaga barathri TaxID=1647451 RepID=A0A3N4M8Q9_9BACT|nr:TonB-dependent receptor [Chitinophaga barathri]RPD40002.1 TonB-dependent receptor [Chitinophaga barathri]